MENLGRKLKNTAIFGAAILGMYKGAEKVGQYNKSEGEQLKSLNQNESVNIKTENPSVIAAEYVDTYQDGPDGEIVNPKEQSVSDVQKSWLLEQMKSSEYQKRALAEGLTQKQIDERINRLDNAPIFHKDTEKVDGDGADGNAFMFASGKTYGMHIGKGEGSKRETFTVHESEHVATALGADISDRAKQFYDDSYQSSGHTEKYEKYLKSFTERDARKKQLEYEIERLGIKNYGDVYTEEIHKKVMDAYHAGYLNYGAKQFIESTKPEFFIQIMNEIAQDQAPADLPLENQG